METDENTGAEGADTSETDTSGEQDHSASDDGGSDQRVPLSVVQAERQKRQALEARLAELDAAREAQEREAAEKRGEFEKLYGTAKQQADELAAKVKVYEEREQAHLADLEASNAKRLKSIPAKLRVGLDGLPADTLAGLLPALEEAAGASAGGTRSRGSGTRPHLPESVLRGARHQWDGSTSLRDRYADFDAYAEVYAASMAKHSRKSP